MFEQTELEFTCAYLWHGLNMQPGARVKTNINMANTLLARGIVKRVDNGNPPSLDDRQDDKPKRSTDKPKRSKAATKPSE